MRAVRDLGGAGNGAIIGYFPVARLNPYQSLLYSQAWSGGYAPVGLFDVDDLEALEAAVVCGTPAVLHIHWTSAVTAGAESQADAEEMSSSFLLRLEKLKAAGVKLVWTVHNVLPHQCRFQDVEVALRQSLAETVDRIHVLTPDTPAETERHYVLPRDRLIQIPHPSYIDAYPRHHDRLLSRFELGYGASDVIIGMIGSIQPYKGIDLLIEASRVARETLPDLQVLVAGIPGRDAESSQLLEDIDRALHVRCLPRKLDPNEIALISTALDAAVLPYRASLNSGAALLALSFGVPIIAPRIGHFRQLLELGLGVGYDPKEPTGLTSALQSFPEFMKQFEPQAALDYCERMSSKKISHMFFKSLTESFDDDFRRSPEGSLSQ